MNNKNSMTKLRNKIVRYFALATFAVAVAESALDSTYDKLYGELYPNAPDGMSADPLSIMYILFSLLLYVIGGIVFYSFTKKAIQKESARQANEQNMVYAAVAHDLKTPMTSVQGFAKALADGKISPDEQQEICNIIYRKSRSMNELVNTLFDYAKYGTEEYGTNPSEFDLCALVRDIAAENYCDLEEHNITPEFDIPDEPVMITADRQELRRALTNLVVNAYKHNPEGISVLIRVRSENGRSVVTVADSGKEIPRDINIFEPFVTENTARTAGQGSGLGLAVTKRIIERCGGKISLSEAPDSYTKAFVVTL